MKGFRKEYIIFIAVVALLVVLLVVYAISNSKSYKKYNIVDEPTASSSSDVSGPNVVIEPDISESPSGVVSADPEDTKPVGDSSSDGDEILSGDTNGEHTDVLPSQSSEVTDQDGGTGDTDIGELDVTGDITTPPPPSSEVFESVVRYYVCGLYDDTFDTYLTQELLDKFSSVSDSEPYSTLKGNITFSDVQYTDSLVSFVAKNGISYSFEYTVVDGLISEIRFLP